MPTPTLCVRSRGGALGACSLFLLKENEALYNTNIKIQNNVNGYYMHALVASRIQSMNAKD